MSDLSTRYMGLTLTSPLVVSGSPLCDTAEAIARLEDHGIAAAVLPTLFEEQLSAASLHGDDELDHNVPCTYESLSFFPDLRKLQRGPDRYLELIHKTKRRVGIPVIASINALTHGGWIEFAGLIEKAGADAIELNINSIVTDVTRAGAELERDVIQLVSHLKRKLRVPLAIKLSPFSSAPANFGYRLSKAGADALVLFDGAYQPDFDIEDRQVVPGEALSGREDLRARLHWVAVLYGQVAADLAVTGGISTERDLVKCFMAGARAAFVSSALSSHGVKHARRMLAALNEWLDEREYASVEEMCGSMSYRAVPNPVAYERKSYMRALGPYPL